MDPDFLFLFHLLKKNKITEMKTHIFYTNHSCIKTQLVLLIQESVSTDEERKAE